MSTRIVAAEILALVELVNAGLPPDDGKRIDVGDVQQFVAPATGAAGTATIEFTVPGDHCAVVVAVEDFNADESAARTISQSQSNEVITEVNVAQWVIGGDLLIVFPPGIAKINITATPEGGKTYYARAVGYLLPFKANRRLSRMSTKIFTEA